MLLPEDEKDFLYTLAAYEEEFGPENLIITVPISLLKSTYLEDFKPAKIKMWKRQFIEIKSTQYSANYILEV